MKIVITGGAGVIGQKLGAALARRGHLRGKDISSIALADIGAPVEVDGCRFQPLDIVDETSVAAAIPEGTDVIYHLAAVVSAHAEEVFADGMAINLDGTRHILDRARALGTAPVVVFSSSIAVYGGEVPDPITDYSALNPQTSYGAQKAMGEALVNDYSRRGFIDGRAFRLPTISVRPGKPNRAASSFMSSILREPLQGEEAVCPVARDFRHYYLSPRRCVENLILGAELQAEAIGQNRAMQMPGRTWSIDQVIAAMTAVAGAEPASRIKFESQPEVERIVSGWRFDIHADKALRLGLKADESFEDNIRFFIEDDMRR